MTAAQFALCGFDVSVQYGANQPEYDLMSSQKEIELLKVSVKDSQDGSWGLTQSHMKMLIITERLMSGSTTRFADRILLGSNSKR